MATILQQIIMSKEGEIESARLRVPEAELRSIAKDIGPKRPFAEALRQAHLKSQVGIIAEIKRASPSRGNIRAELDPADYAARYEAGGAVAVSVLTDMPYFNGSISDLRQARMACSLPVLRKEFIISPYQILESAAFGADAVLLVAGVLSASQLVDFIGLCREVNLGALVEIRNTAELEKATDAGADILGINNRDLNTFTVDTCVAPNLARRLSTGQVPVAASGICTRADIEKARSAGINNFLIGEALVRADNTVGFLRSLIEA